MAIGLALINQKGGQFKTTTAVNMSYWFAAQKGLRVLLVDLDPQAHCSHFLGVEANGGVFRFLVDREPLGNLVIQPRSTLPNLHLLASNKKTANLESELRKKLAGKASPALVLFEALRKYASQYDLFVFDNQPSVSLPQVMSLVASDTYIIPAWMDSSALDGMTQTLESVKALKEFPAIIQPTLLGVLPTNFSEARKGDLEKYQEVATKFKLILPCIRTDSNAARAVDNQMTIWEFAPRAKSATGSKKPIGLEGANSLGLHGGYLHLCEIVDALIPQIERRTKYARN